MTFILNLFEMYGQKYYWRQVGTTTKRAKRTKQIPNRTFFPAKIFLLKRLLLFSLTLVLSVQLL